MGLVPVVIVTGASRGIGYAIAQELLKNKARVVLVARSSGPLQNLQKQFPDQVQVVTGDVTDHKTAKDAITSAVSTWDRIDCLVANHGTMGSLKRIADSDPDEWAKTVNINTLSVMNLIKNAIPKLRESKGRVIMVSSGAATNGYAGWGAYGSSKAMMNHLALTMAAEEKDITTVAIRPGVVDTEMQQQIRDKDFSAAMSESDKKKFHGLKTERSLLQPEQPGNVIARLALNAPANLSGQFLSWNSPELKEFQN